MSFGLVDGPPNGKGTAGAPIFSINVVLSGLQDRCHLDIVRGVPGDSTRTSSDDTFVMGKLA